MEGSSLPRRADLIVRYIGFGALLPTCAGTYRSSGTWRIVSGSSQESPDVSLIGGFGSLFPLSRMMMPKRCKQSLCTFATLRLKRSTLSGLFCPPK
jgi:hypothetical protein